MEGVALKKIKLQPINSKLCIICQKTTNCTLTSTLPRQQKIIEVSKLKNDIVYSRIQQIPSGHKSEETSFCRRLELALCTNTNENPRSKTFIPHFLFEFHELVSSYTGIFGKIVSQENA